MQSIAEDCASDDAASTTSNMSISSYSLSTSSTLPLQYPQFGTTNHLELPNISILHFVKLEDDEVKDKDKPVLSPVPFTAMSPVQIKIKIKIKTDKPTGPNPISTPKAKNATTNNLISDFTTVTPFCLVILSYLVRVIILYLYSTSILYYQHLLLTRHLPEITEISILSSYMLSIPCTYLLTILGQTFSRLISFMPVDSR